MSNSIVLTINDYRERLEQEKTDIRYADEMMDITPCHTVDYQKYEELKAQAKANVAKLEEQIANMHESEVNWQWLWDKCVDTTYRMKEWQMQYDCIQAQ